MFQVLIAADLQTMCPSRLRKSETGLIEAPSHGFFFTCPTFSHTGCRLDSAEQRRHWNGSTRWRYSLGCSRAHGQKMAMPRFTWTQVLDHTKRYLLGPSVARAIEHSASQILPLSRRNVA